MRIVLIADAFPPLRTSGAVQVRDLARALAAAGHRPTVLVPDPDLATAWSRDMIDGVEVLRLKSPRTKDIGYVRRTLGELMMPYAMLGNLRKSPLADARWDAVAWYAPSIFLAPVARALKRASRCRSYLIVRDIFPEWALDMGLMKRGIPYYFFKIVERYQYAAADVIGVQSPSNLPYFSNGRLGRHQAVEVLQNWLADAPDKGCSIAVAAGPLAGRKVFVYAGNMGVAQGMDILLALAERLLARRDIGFLFVGRGSDAQRLRRAAAERRLDNVVFHDEIDPVDISGLYAQCDAGIVALDPRHRTHNVPGKFLSYLQSGLPVLACINPGNDLAEMIVQEGVGRVCTDHQLDTLERAALQLMDDVATDGHLAARCRALSARRFSPEATVKQLSAAFGFRSAPSVVVPRRVPASLTQVGETRRDQPAPQRDAA